MVIAVVQRRRQGESAQVSVQTGSDSGLAWEDEVWNIWGRVKAPAEGNGGHTSSEQHQELERPHEKMVMTMMMMKCVKRQLHETSGPSLSLLPPHSSTNTFSLSPFCHRLRGERRWASAGWMFLLMCCKELHGGPALPLLLFTRPATDIQKPSPATFRSSLLSPWRRTLGRRTGFKNVDHLPSSSNLRSVYIPHLQQQQKKQYKYTPKHTKTHTHRGTFRGENAECRTSLACPRHT